MKEACFQCQAPFDCGVDAAQCWCFKLPHIPLAPSSAPSCLCPNCLSKRAERLGEMTCFRLNIAYLGQAFGGFQYQPNARTVEAEITKALSSITQQAVKIKVAGRTDAGVHAKGQAASVALYTKLSPHKLTLALSSLLPPDLRVFRIDRVPLGFNAQRQSVGKQYVYRIQQGLTPDPFLQKDAVHIRQPLNAAAMAEAARSFVGEHDFDSFRSTSCTYAHATRFVWHVGVEQKSALMEIDIRGNAFCLNMVRIMVGTLIEVGRGKRAPSSIGELFAAKDRRLAGITAKAHGLSLEKVYYPDDLKHALIPADAVFPRYPVSEESWPYAPSDIEYGPS